MATTSTAALRTRRFVVLRNALSLDEQRKVVDEVFRCPESHERQGITNSGGHDDEKNDDGDEWSPPEQAMAAAKATRTVSIDWKNLLRPTTTSSFKLDLGISCGETLRERLPFSFEKAKSLFRAILGETIVAGSGDRDETMRSTESSSPSVPLRRLADPHSPLTGLALVYGPHAFMKPHYDSPTQPQQRDEWLVMMTVGAAVEFVCQDEVLVLMSGDALIMDSMAVKHGINRILPAGDYSSANPPNPHPQEDVLPVQDARLGILFWQGKCDGDDRHCHGNTMVEAQMEGIAALFQDDDDDDDDENEFDGIVAA